MLRIYKYIFALIFSAIACTVGYSQQTTKADLLKLFFQANQSVKNGNNDDAKKFYTEIIKLSPGLPEPYLNLGNLYSQEINNEKPLMTLKSYRWLFRFMAFLHRITLK